MFYNTVQIAPPPRDMLLKPPTHQPVVPEVQSASPPRGLLQTPPANQPIPPKLPDNKAPLFAPIAPCTICSVLLASSTSVNSICININIPGVNSKIQ